MKNVVISVENLSKRYDLGVIGTGTVSRDLNRWWAKVRRRPDPYAIIGEADHGNREGQSILALSDVNFTVEQGEVLGIIGRNGAGKSTLLKILSQVTAPSDGKVKIKGRIGSLLEVGTGFHPELTGRENIFLNGAILGMSRSEVSNKFNEIVDFSGVEKFVDTPVKRYSSGMYVRLAFAVAAHLEPEILIVDEVLAVGDAEFQKKCLGKMSDVAKGGRTVLFVSHNMGAVQNICSRGLLLRSGQLVLDDDVKKVVGSYINNLSNELTLSNRFQINQSKQMNLTHIAINNGRGSEIFESADGLHLDIEYLIHQPVKSAHIICMFYNQNGTCVFSTSDADSDSNMFNERSKGKYKASFNIPANLLNEGIYSVTISMGVPYVQVYDRYEGAIQFQIMDNLSERKKFQHQVKPGVITLTIPWNVEKKN